MSQIYTDDGFNKLLSERNQLVDKIVSLESQIEDRDQEIKHLNEMLDHRNNVMLPELHSEISEAKKEIEVNELTIKMIQKNFNEWVEGFESHREQLKSGLRDSFEAMETAMSVDEIKFKKLTLSTVANERLTNAIGKCRKLIGE